jgi:hypothetical protein
MKNVMQDGGGRD